mmetsp:Transcript_74592/g.132247  ORF Transcript_74592/g.132247 Transcript_74592/m.132247 type:complete len:600 (+) Transcript_74592:72-1871(+)
MTRLLDLVWRLVLLIAAADAVKSRSPQLSSTVQAVQSSLQAEAKKDDAAYDKVACWCQTQMAERQQTSEKMRQEHDVLAHDIEEETARTTRIDLELGSHENELADSVTTLHEANALRKKEAEKYDESEKSHMQSINQLDQALQAISRNHASELALSLVQRAAKGRAHAGVAESQLAKLKMQLRGGAANSPEVVRGVIEQMKTMFKEDLSDMRQSEMAAKEHHDGITAAKSEEITSLKKQIMEKKQRSATTKVVLGHKKEFLERSEKLLDINTQLLGVLKTSCTRNDGSHQQRQEAQQAALPALSSALAELSGAGFLGVGTAARARQREQVLGDGVELVCGAAREIFEEKAWKAKAQAACEKARAGGVAALQDAADDVESLEDDIKAELEDARHEQSQCEASIHEAEADASAKEQEASVEASFVGSEKAATASEIEDAESQVAGAKQAKTDLLELRSAQHRVMQASALALTHDADLLRKALAAGGNGPAAVKIEEAEGQLKKLLAVIGTFDKEADADVQRISALLDDVQLAAGKVLIPLRLMHADSEEAAVAIDEEAEARSTPMHPQCDAASLRKKVELLSGHAHRLSTAAERLAMDALR